MRRGVLALVAAGWFAGCGPIAYVSQVTREAASKVEEARSLGADTHSPYWWTRATTYLRMAREVAAHADFQGANRFGRLSAEAADQAADEARAHGNDTTRRSGAAAAERAGAPTQELAPAKDDAGSAPATDTGPEKGPEKDTDEGADDGKAKARGKAPGTPRGKAPGTRKDRGKK